MCLAKVVLPDPPSPTIETIQPFSPSLGSTSLDMMSSFSLSRSGIFDFSTLLNKDSSSVAWCLFVTR
uniref:Uncharacterized protein n=1 Tax=Arundo donax TaxID=35708 RepID=A0A0A9BVB9_ARUDO